MCVTQYLFVSLEAIILLLAWTVVQLWKRWDQSPVSWFLKSLYQT